MDCIKLFKLPYFDGKAFLKSFFLRNAQFRPTTVKVSRQYARDILKRKEFMIKSTFCCI